MESKFEIDNVITYEVSSNVDGIKKHVYATDSLEDLIKIIKNYDNEYKLKNSRRND